MNLSNFKMLSHLFGSISNWATKREWWWHRDGIPRGWGYFTPLIHRRYHGITRANFESQQICLKRQSVTKVPEIDTQPKGTFISEVLVRGQKYLRTSSSNISISLRLAEYVWGNSFTMTHITSWFCPQLHLIYLTYCTCC
jgi:hypothetical protein